ncbi:MAG: sulfide/dihydroorotate dehydrogenase-like FAD/NAD-binding protein [Candidatus Omnitrophota bacterium]|jgi:ferredoxin--NADP+ reductase
MHVILEKLNLGPKIYSITVDVPFIAKKAQAGQFVMVKLHEKGERVPLTISDYDRDKGTITIVFQDVGKTSGLLASMNTGDRITDILGPQGNPTEIALFGTVIVVGGGIGVAPVYPLAQALREKGNYVISALGYRSKEHVFWEDKLRSVSDEVYLATNDGSYGKKGFVTDALKEILDAGKHIDRVFAIGPTIMMKGIVDVAKRKNIPVVVSLNSLMVCGMGMCGACRVTIAGKVRFTCMDGPDFDGAGVDFEELMQRLDTYKHEESH